MAIHDAAYAAPAQSWRQFRWRLQHLSEERVGRLMRRAGRAEDAAWQSAVGAAQDAG